MLKRIGVILTVALSLLVQAGFGRMQVSDRKMVDSFMKLGGAGNTAYVTVNGAYTKGYIDREECERIKEYITTAGGLSEDMVAITQQEGSFYVSVEAVYEITGTVGGGRQITERRDTLEKLCRESGFSVKSYITMECNAEGKLSEGQMDELTDKILGELDCDSLDKSNLSSEKMDCIYYSFSPLLSDSIEIGSRRINITVAFTYDEEKDVTMIYAATPILNQSI